MATRKSRAGWEANVAPIARRAVILTLLVISAHLVAACASSPSELASDPTPSSALPAPSPVPLPTDPLRPAFSRDLDALPHIPRYTIELEIDPAANLVTGHQEIRYTNTEQVSLNEVFLRLFLSISTTYNHTRPTPSSRIRRTGWPASSLLGAFSPPTGAGGWTHEPGRAVSPRAGYRISR